MERVMILSPGDGSVTAEILSFLRVASGPAGAADAFTLPPGGLCLESLENDLVRQAMSSTGNNQSAAANLLGLTRAKFRVLVKQMEMTKNSDSTGA
ncbi:MAG: sigma-54-dependent Fis family transcriptional regulator, partial [Desulfobacteraceae bacterium]|nr:sigma-54-dependent Fis family transcriptional regulator [Desulfobacteraceae bacterium]